jgi:hypothetical protein
MPIDYDDDDELRGEGSPMLRAAYLVAVVWVKGTIAAAILFACGWFWLAVGRLFLGFLQGITE